MILAERVIVWSAALLIAQGPVSSGPPYSERYLLWLGLAALVGVHHAWRTR